MGSHRYSRAGTRQAEVLHSLHQTAILINHSSSVLPVEGNISPQQEIPLA